MPPAKDAEMQVRVVGVSVADDRQCVCCVEICRPAFAAVHERLRQMLACERRRGLTRSRSYHGGGPEGQLKQLAALSPDGTGAPSSQPFESAYWTTGGVAGGGVGGDGRGGMNRARAASDGRGAATTRTRTRTASLQGSSLDLNDSQLHSLSSGGNPLDAADHDSGNFF